MNSIKVSVIVPVYNVEQYLPRCLDSLVNQTLKEIEILVINDGSPDNSQAIIDDYARRYPDKIRPFIKENGGLSDARNYGIAKASGEYLAFVDSDDYVDIDMFEKLYARAAETDAEVVACPVAYEHASVVRKRYYTGKEHLFGKSAVESPGLFVLTNSYAWNKIYRREFWLRGNYSFPKQHFEDSALIYGLMLDANKVECVNIAFYHYDQTRDDAITKNVDRRIFDIFKSCESIIASFTPRIEQNAAVREMMATLCVRHILPRIKTLARSGNRAFTKEFLAHAYAFLDEKLPDWKSCSAVNATEEDGLKSKVSKWIFRHRVLAKTYYCLPVGLRKLAHKAIAFLRKVKRKLTSSAAAVEKEKERKRAAIQSYGLSLIAFVQESLQEIGICSFADFGTMLGIIREGKLLAHDLDVDIGVILNESFDVHRIRVAMERNGFTLWRQYIMGDQLVEESYRLGDLKVDFNYYRMDETCAKTWLFYRKPGHKYEAINHRHIVEMTYSPIREMQTVTVAGTEIVIPKNAEQILVEKYGASWRTPDKGWIYWQSPAATQIEGVGHFITHEYRNMGKERAAYCNDAMLALLKKLQQKES